MSAALGADLRERVDAALAVLGHGRIELVQPVGGGCISPAARVRTSDEADFFIKWSADSGRSHEMFAAEARALASLGAAGTLRIPEVRAIAEPDRAGSAWLLMEWLREGVPARRTWESLGRGLAGLHQIRGSVFGGQPDNFIGTLPQTNEDADDWPAFWRDRRLLPQLERALAGGHFHGGERRRFDALFGAMDDLLAAAHADGASLLHGDLWRGNLLALDDGEPALVDPSSYFGHREVDLAMTRLFGGFDSTFEHAYEEVWPLAPGFEPRRCAVYQLYYLLVHVNLFGASYRPGTLEALRAAGF